MTDSATGAMTCAENRKIVTLNASINYLKHDGNVDQQYMYRQAVKAGLSTSFYQVAIKTKKNVKVAIVQVTMFFLE